VFHDLGWLLVIWFSKPKVIERNALFSHQQPIKLIQLEQNFFLFTYNCFLFYQNLFFIMVVVILQLENFRANIGTKIATYDLRDKRKAKSLDLMVAIK